MIDADYFWCDSLSGLVFEPLCHRRPFCLGVSPLRNYNFLVRSKNFNFNISEARRRGQWRPSGSPISPGAGKSGPGKLGQLEI